VKNKCAKLFRLGLNAWKPLGPFMPVGLKASKCTAFDISPPIISLWFQLANGKILSDHECKPLIADLFDDPAFSIAVHKAINNGTMLKRIGEF
jgi:fructose 1,6-bisphosphatase